MSLVLAVNADHKLTATDLERDITGVVTGFRAWEPISDIPQSEHTRLIAAHETLTWRSRKNPISLNLYIVIQADSPRSF